MFLDMRKSAFVNGLALAVFNLCSQMTSWVVKQSPLLMLVNTVVLTTVKLYILSHLLCTF